MKSTLTIIFLMFFISLYPQERNKLFTGPDSSKAIISLSFDDARLSQIDVGIPFLNNLGVKATFYLNPGGMKERLSGWKNAVAQGHEIGNHSMTHPCSGNYSWVGNGNELENLTLSDIRKNLLDCSKAISDELGVTPTLFAYPCGQKFIGRGKKAQSYVPVVSELFASGRSWLDNMDNDPLFCDFAQLAARDMDEKDFEEILPIIESAKAQGKWLILAGHDMGDTGRQTTRINMLKKLIEYAKNPANKVWLAPVGEAQLYLKNWQSTHGRKHY